MMLQMLEAFPLEARIHEGIPSHADHVDPDKDDLCERC